MAKEKKAMTDKYYVAEEVGSQVKDILSNYGDVFTHFAFNDIIFLFKTGKNKPEKKHVNVKIIKEPLTLLTHKKIMFVVTDEWWKDSNNEERARALVEGLVSIDIGKGGELTKRAFDFVTYSELVNDDALNFKRFKKLFAGEKEDLVLTPK
jgi:hypothetical protein